MDYLLQRRWINNHIIPILNQYASSNDGSITQKDVKKLKYVYSYIVVILVVAPFQEMRRVQFGRRDRSLFGYVGILSGLIDDYFDHFKFTTEKINDLIFYTNEFIPENSHQFLTKHFLNEFWSSVNKGNIEDNLKKVIYWQAQSLNQMNSDIEDRSLEYIITQKAGYSVLFYCDMILPPVDDADRNMIWHLSAMIQVANDIFDIFKDHKEGIYTTVNKMSDPLQIKAHFEKYIHQWIVALKSLKYEENQKVKFADKIQFLVISRTLVCIEQYISLYNETGHFNISSFTRKQLVCDMEKMENIKRWFRIFFSNPYPIS